MAPSFILGQDTLQWLYLEHPASEGDGLTSPDPSYKPPICLLRFFGCLVLICILSPLALAFSFLVNSGLHSLPLLCIGGLAWLCVKSNLILSSFLFLFFLLWKIKSLRVFSSSSINFFPFPAGLHYSRVWHTSPLLSVLDCMEFPLYSARGGWN